MEEVNCSNCYRILAEPTCMKCFIREVATWVDEQKLHESTKDKMYNSLISFFTDSKQLDAESCCVICTKEVYTTLCMHCMMKEVAQRFKGIIRSSVSLEQFDEIFNREVYEYGLVH